MAVTRSVDRAVFGVVFLLVFVFSYSYEIVGGFFDAIGYGDRRELWIVTVFVLEALIVGATAILKRSIARGDGRGPRLWRWWFAAFAMVVVNDVVVFVAERRQQNCHRHPDGDRLHRRYSDHHAVVTQCRPAGSVQRRQTSATVVLMSIGLMGAVSTLPWRNDECGQILAGWHEYLTFVFSLQAIFTGLVTLVWLLIVNVPNPGETTAES